MNILFVCMCFCLVVFVSSSEKLINKKNNDEVFAWKQLGYDFDGIKYENSTDTEYKKGAIHFPQDLDDSEKFFIQSNNVPIGFEVYGDRVFITVPRRRHGIPSTLNYINLKCDSTLLKPYPDVERSRQFFSVYRPRVDACHRLWMVDTGHLEVPGARKQVQPPAIVIYDLKTDRQILRHELHKSLLVNERTSAGLTSITVDVEPEACGKAFAYINDLATEGLIVYSLEDQKSWRVEHPSFRHDEGAMNFTAAGHIITWRDGLFSIALSAPGEGGSRTAYYHPLVSTQEFSVDTAVLKNKAKIEDHFKVVGNRGPNSQSGSHDIHHLTGTIFYANVAQDAILCWNTRIPMTPENVVLVAQDSKKLAYISDLKVSGNEVWVLANQIPKFIFNTQNRDDFNYFVLRFKVQDLIKDTACDQKTTKKTDKE